MGSSVWASQRFDAAEPGAVQVEVTGMQFAWYFRYPGPDGKFGATSPKLMDPSAGGEAAVGLNTSDPAAKDDVVTGTMYLPVDREVDVSLRAVDVIHSFFVPQPALQAGRGSGTEYSHALQADADWRIRNCLRRTLRAWALQDARHGPRRQPGGFRQVAGGTGGGETINGDRGFGSRARSSGFHPKIHFQPRSQSHWHSVFLSGAHGGVRRDVSCRC